MSEHAAHAPAPTPAPHEEVPISKYVGNWVVLLALTALQIGIALKMDHKEHFFLKVVVLMAISLLNTGISLAVFMHLKYERATFWISIVPATAITIALTMICFPDSLRVRDFGHTEPKVAEPLEAEHKAESEHKGEAGKSEAKPEAGKTEAKPEAGKSEAAPAKE